MACSLIRSVVTDPDEPGSPKVPGRIVTTEAKAKELRPYIEKLITLARKAIVHQERADELAPSAKRNSEEWKSWRNSERWNEWNQAVAPAVALRRRAFSILRDNEAVDILFETLAPKYVDRPGGYTRVVRLAEVRLGDSGKQALIEFVGDERDRAKSSRQTRPAPVVSEEPAGEEEAASESAAEDTSVPESSPEASSETESSQTESSEAASAADSEDKNEAE